MFCRAAACGLGYIHAPRDPDLIAQFCKPNQHFFKSREARWPPRDAQMIADIEQARLALPGFSKQHIQRIIHIFHHLTGAYKAIWVEELHVIGV